MAGSSVGLHSPARMAIFAAVIVGIMGFLLANTLLGNVASNSALAISNSVNNTSNGPHLPGTFLPGSYSSCFDTDGGNNPGEPGATINIYTGHPVVGGSALSVLPHLATVIGSQAGIPGQYSFTIDYIHNHRHYQGTMVVSVDRATMGDSFTIDQPVGSEPGSPSGQPDEQKLAVLTEYYCYYSSTSGGGLNPSYAYSSAITAVHIGREYDSDFIDYPKGFFNFVTQSVTTIMNGYSYPSTANYLPSDADYLVN